MATILEQAAADIAALGTEAGGCDCTFTPAAGGAASVRAVVTHHGVEDARHGRGPTLPAHRRSKTTFLLDRIQDSGNIAIVREGDRLTVPGHKVGRPDQATVEMKITSPVSVEGSHWTGELT